MLENKLIHVVDCVWLGIPKREEKMGEKYWTANRKQVSWAKESCLYPHWKNILSIEHSDRILELKGYSEKTRLSTMEAKSSWHQQSQKTVDSGEMLSQFWRKVILNLEFYIQSQCESELEEQGKWGRFSSIWQFKVYPSLFHLFWKKIIWECPVVNWKRIQERKL